MQRLTELTSSTDPALSRATALLSAMPRLKTTEPPAPAATTQRRGAGWLRPGALGLLGASGLALASLLRPQDGTPRRAFTEPGIAQAAAPADSLAPATVPEISTFGVPSPDSPADESERPSPASRPISTPSTARSKVAPPASSTADEVRRGRGNPPAEPAIDQKDESTLMLAAVRALRRDSDAERAQTLAEESLRRYPNGVQIEEAMALACEAAVARQGAPGARAAAARYLQAFPAGRFVGRAQRILTPASQ